MQIPGASSDFAAGESAEKAERVSEAALTEVALSAVAKGARDLVDMVKRAGGIALPRGFTNLPHMHRPRWRPAPGALLQAQVRATLLSSNRVELWPTNSLDPLPRSYQIKFEAFQGSGLPLPADYEVKWRVTNTDKEARAHRALRGDFYSSDHGNVRFEGLQYRGVHMVEAFIIRKRDQRMVGMSSPHMVVIE